MKPRQATPRVCLLLSLLAAAITGLYMHRILLPWEHYFHVEAGTLKAALGDLYSPWFGTRSLLLYRKNPYGAEVTHDIQTAFYGHDIRAGAPGTRPIDEQRFAYPVYVVLLLAPTANVEFVNLQAWAPLVLALAVVGSVGLWLSVLRWRPPKMKAWALIVFVLASPQIAQGLRLRQLGLLVACLLALGTWLVVRNQLLAAGAVLALATIKPQMIALPLAWFVLWTIGDIRQRWRLLGGFCITLGLLAGAGEFLLPGWPRDFLAGLMAYRKYGPVTSLLQLALGNTAGALIVGFGIAALCAWGWKRRKHSAESPAFTYCLSVFLMGAALALPLMTPFNQILLVLPLLILLRDWARLTVAARAVFVFCVSWSWIASLALLVLPLQLKSVRPIPLLPSALELLLPFLLPLLLSTGRMLSPEPSPNS
jgi:glycosyl transferase family 87